MEGKRGGLRDPELPHHPQFINGPENAGGVPTINGSWKKDVVSSPDNLQKQLTGICEGARETGDHEQSKPLGMGRNYEEAQ